MFIAKYCLIQQWTFLNYKVHLTHFIYLPDGLLALLFVWAVVHDGGDSWMSYGPVSILDRKGLMSDFETCDLRLCACTYIFQ